MGVIYKHGLYFERSKKKMFIIGLSLVLIGVSLLIIKFIGNKRVSVKEHASTKLEPAIMNYKAEGHCEGNTFVIKYTLRIKTPPMENDPPPVSFNLKAFIPGVVKKSWITYVSGGGKIGGQYYIKWTGKIPDNSMRDFVYTIALPGGTLQPGAEFKNIALLTKENGAIEKRTSSIIVNNCGVKSTNPITPVPTQKQTLVDSTSINNNQQENQNNTNDNISTSKNGLEDFVTDVTSNTDFTSSKINNTGNVTSSTDTNSNYENETQQFSNPTVSDHQTEEANTVPSYVTSPQYYNNASTNINTGVIDSPITVGVILLIGLVVKFLFKKKHSKHFVLEESF